MAQQMEGVIDLTLGDPDMSPAQGIKDAACRAILEGKTRYSANAGLLEARTAITECFSSDYGLAIDPNSEILLTVGGMEALFLSLACLIDKGDEVVIQAPYYVNYLQMIRMLGGVPVVVGSDPASGEAFNVEGVREALSDRTVALIVNTPCNPSGLALSEADADRISSIAREHDLMVISDEVYKTLLYDGREHQSVITREGMRERTVVIDSMSKRFAMTGYRLGYVVAPGWLVSNMTMMQENVAACAPLPSQYAAIEAYGNFSSDCVIQREFESRRNLLCSELEKSEHLVFHRPEGAFYVFVSIEKTGLDSLAYCEELLRRYKVATVPGLTYGEGFDNYIRIAFTVGGEKLKEAAARIVEFTSEKVDGATSHEGGGSCE